jgi:hypothetical protein
VRQFFKWVFVLGVWILFGIFCIKLLSCGYSSAIQKQGNVEWHPQFPPDSVKYFDHFKVFYFPTYNDTLKATCQEDESCQK